MSVEEVIQQIRAMSQEERRQVQAALAELDTDSHDEAIKQRGEEAWDRLLKGFGSAGGKHLSANIG